MPQKSKTEADGGEEGPALTNGNDDMPSGSKYQQKKAKKQAKKQAKVTQCGICQSNERLR